MYVSCLIYADAIWGLDDAYIEIGELSNLLVGYTEVPVDPFKEVFEEVGAEIRHTRNHLWII